VIVSIPFTGLLFFKGGRGENPPQYKVSIPFTGLLFFKVVAVAASLRRLHRVSIPFTGLLFFKVLSIAENVTGKKVSIPFTGLLFFKVVTEQEVKCQDTDGFNPLHGAFVF